MNDVIYKKKETAKKIVGEYMDVIMELSIVDADDKEQCTKLELKRDSLQTKMKDKVKGIDYFSQNITQRDYLLSAEIEAHKDEIERLRTRQKALTATNDYLNKVLLPMLIEELGDNNGVLETDTARYKLYETYGSVIVTDQDKVPNDFIKTKITQTIDKAKARKVCMQLHRENTELPDGLSITKVKRVKRS